MTIAPAQSPDRAPASEVARPTGQRRALVLVVDDDRGLNEMLTRVLVADGYDAVGVTDGRDALSFVAEEHPDLVILDVVLPSIDGYEVCRRIRANHRLLPIIMLTSRAAIADRVIGLDQGADDYLAKPFDLTELSARVRAVLRRSRGVGDGRTISAGEITIDLVARTARRLDEHLDLTRVEFDLLVALVESPGAVLTKEILRSRIWGIDFATRSRSLDVHIGHLRRKTEAGGCRRVIHTVRGVGYRFEP
jgi:two-component system, OmpR family, response regulator MprA